MEELAKNDGLSPEDFSQWFKIDKGTKGNQSGVLPFVWYGCVIHFTEFKY